MSVSRYNRDPNRLAAPYGNRESPACWRIPRSARNSAERR
jgi:hypothetical protein